ncbi:MAG: hypothetical protein F6K11_20615 [Leptolyngbya sp. SIO3F4]|nr:hypothetical protein [Leptolyngbya sp. SIO3F4]
MDYVYYLSNASLVLRVVERLHSLTQLPLEFVSVIHRIDGWIVRIRLHESVSPNTASNFQSFLNEVGGHSAPGYRIRMALWGLETGQTPVDVMRRYQVAVVSHGKPDRYEIEEFRKQFVQGLGYCPETLA